MLNRQHIQSKPYLSDILAEEGRELPTRCEMAHILNSAFLNRAQITLFHQKSWRAICRYPEGRILAGAGEIININRKDKKCAIDPSLSEPCLEILQSLLYFSLRYHHDYCILSLNPHGKYYTESQL